MNIQDYKNEARKIALKVGCALERRGDEVYCVTADGDEELLVHEKNTEDLWKETHSAIKEKVDGKSVEKTTKPASKSTSVKRVLIFCDGGSRGNPGPSASGYVIYNGENDKILEEGGEYLGITTNNQAEYHSLRMAFEAVEAYAPEDIDVFMDSQLVVNQLNGVYKIRNKDLWPVYQKIKKMAEEYPSVRFSHVLRDRNKAADAIVNQILDAELKK